MKRMKGITGLLSCALLLAIAGCRSEETPARGETGLTKEAALKPRPVEVTEPVRHAFARSIQFTGTLKATRKARLRSLAEGRIEQIPVEVGDRVDKGQLLFQIRTIDYELKVRQATAAIAVAEANVLSSQVNLQDAEREKKRMESLYKAGSATEQMWDRARTQFERATAMLEQAKASLSEARVRLDVARQALEDCTVTAPYPAFVTGKFHEQGEYARRGEEVVEIMDLTNLEAEVRLPERFVRTVSTGYPVTLSISSTRSQVQGRIIAVNPKIDPSNRTFLIKIGVANQEGELKAGLFCTGRIELPPIREALAVPASALQNEEGRFFVWVVEEDRARKRFVEPGLTEGNLVQIAKGLRPGERVVVEGQGGLMDGSPVAVEVNPQG